MHIWMTCNAYLVNCHVVGEEVVADVELDAVVTGGGGAGRRGRVRRAIVPDLIK